MIKNNTIAVNVKTEMPVNKVVKKEEDSDDLSDRECFVIIVK